MMTKMFLREKGISFVEKNVDTDENALNELREKSSAMSVPVIDIDGTIIEGFREEEIKKALGLKSNSA